MLEYDAGNLAICQKVGKYFQFATNYFRFKNLNDTSYRRNTFILKSLPTTFNYFTYKFIVTGAQGISGQKYFVYAFVIVAQNKFS